MRSPEQKRADLEERCLRAEARAGVLETENEKLKDAFARQDSSMAFRQTQITWLRDAVKRDEARIAECARLEVSYQGAIDALMKTRKERAALEDALAASAEMLLTYKDYYGTSIAQVKHLAECAVCMPPELEPSYCPDYPTE